MGRTIMTALTACPSWGGGELTAPRTEETAGAAGVG